MTVRTLRTAVTALRTLEAMGALASASLRLRTTRFAPTEPADPLPSYLRERVLGEADGVIADVARADRLLLRRTSCLARAVAAHALLARRNIAAVIACGVRKRDGAFAAHAWIEVGDVVFDPRGDGQAHTFATRLVPFARGRV